MHTQRVSNPYVSRGPVRSPEMFFGREYELREIAAFLQGNQSVAIVGPRKIGKTSLLFHLLRPETRAMLGLNTDPGAGMVDVLTYLDCEVLGSSNPEEIFATFASEIVGTLDSMELPPEPALETVIAKPTRLAFEGAIRKLNQRKLRVVLILDEFERLSTNTTLDVNFFNALRSAAGRYQLVFITGSARPLIELTYSEQAQEILSSPFFNIFAPLFLGLLSENEARQLIGGPSSGRFSPEMEIFLYRFAGGHPLALQVACFHAFNAPDDLALAEENALRELDAHFQYYWRNLSVIEQETLTRLHDAAEHVHTDTTLRTALRDLVQKALLVQENGLYHYPSRAWEAFVATQVGIRSNSTTISTHGGLLTGSVIGPYEVNELIGRGGMAEVYKGRHGRLNRTVAIKVLAANLAGEIDFRRRFEREARAIAALKHPHIVSVFDFGDIEGIYYMVMEYIAGKALNQHLRENDRLSFDEALCVTRDVSHALDYAHQQGLVHRDVKPSNMMLEPSTASHQNGFGMRVVLTDFGIVKLATGSAAGTRTEGLTGTLDYMAPEQIRLVHDLDGRADVYSLGVVFYQMITGHLPFTGENPAHVLMGHLQEAPPDPRQFVPELPTALSQTMLRALAKHPDDRWQTAGAFVEALEEAYR